MFKNLLKKWSLNVNINFKKNFTSLKLLIIILVVAGLYAVKYVLQYDFDTSDKRQIAIVDWALAPFTLFFLMLFTNKKNVSTYGIYLAIAKVLAILFWVLGHDLKVMASATFFDSIPVDKLFVGISNIMIAGNIIVEVMVLPLFLFAAFINVFEYEMINKVNSRRGMRPVWFTILVALQIVAFWAVFQYVVYPYFGTLSNELASIEFSNSTIPGGGSIKLLKYLQPITAFAFFPLLFVINNNRDSDLFLGRTQEFYIATQITFLIKYLNLYNSNSELYIPIILFSFIAVKMFIFLIIWIRMVVVNTRHTGEADFVPIIVSLRVHRNKYYKHMMDDNLKLKKDKENRKKA